MTLSLPNPYVDDISLLLLVGDAHRLELLAVFVLPLLTPKKFQIEKYIFDSNSFDKKVISCFRKKLNKI
jgi:hypothetical protein